jgi:hypothetical protein
MLFKFPLLILVLAAYNSIVFFTKSTFDTAIFSVKMISGAQWVFNLGDLLVAVALLMLFIELLKATRSGTVSIIDHMLSTFVFIGFLVEFIVIKQAATSVFFLLTIIALIDVIAGYSVTIQSARRDFGVGPGSGMF